MRFRAYLLSLFFLSTCLPVAAQDFVFAGIQWGSGRDTVSARMNAIGLASNFFIMSPGVDLFQGQLQGAPATVAVYTDPAGAAQAIQVIYPLDDKDSLLTQFRILKETLVARYGKPASEAEEFLSPYKNGDGKELEAILKGYLQYQAVWENADKRSQIGLEVTPDPTVTLSYVGPGWPAERERRRQEQLQQQR